MDDNILRSKRKRPKAPKGSQLMIIPANPTKKVSVINFSLPLLRFFCVFWIVVLASAVLYVLNLFARNTQLGEDLGKEQLAAGEAAARLEQIESDYVLLEEKYNLISDTLYSKTLDEAARQADEEKKHKPALFPINSSATAEEVNLGAEGQPAMPALLFEAAQGASVVASGDGVVVDVATDAEYGNIIKIDHKNGYVSIYRYKGTPKVKINSQVIGGTPLFEITEGAGKLAYHIVENDVYIDPMSLMEVSG